jgi:flagellar biosynthesis component FlhA
VPKALSLGEIQRVLRQLLRDRVPVRDLTTILEHRGHHERPRTRSPKVSARRVAAPSAGSIRPTRGELPTIAFSPALEERLPGSIVRTDQAAVLALRSQRSAGPRVPDCARAGDSRGTACASLHSGAPASPLATVRAGAAAHRVLFTQ